MFGILDLAHGKIIFAALFFLVLGTIQSNDAKKYIDKENDKNSANYHVEKLPNVPIGTLIFAIVLLVIALIIPVR